MLGIRRDPRIIRLALIAAAFVLLVPSTGCIALSREVRQQPVAFRTSASVESPGSWEFRQQWQCREQASFDLAHERAVFDVSLEEWTREGWFLSEFQVVSVQASGATREQTCFLASLRRPRTTTD